MRPIRRAEALARALFRLDLSGLPGAILVRQIHRIRMLIGATALVSVWFLPAALHTRAFLFVFVAGVYLPWSFLISRLSREWQGVARLGNLLGDMAIVAVVQFTVPGARFVVLFGYILMAVIYTHLEGKRTGLVVSGIAAGLSVAREAAAGPPSIDAYTLLMFSAVLASAVLLVDAVSGAQREATIRIHRLYSSLEAVASSADVPTVFSTVAREAARALGAAVGLVVVREGDDARAVGASDPRAAAVYERFGRGAFAVEGSDRLPFVRAILEGRRVEVVDAGAGDLPGALGEPLDGLGLRAALCAPIPDTAGAGACLSLRFAAPRSFDDVDRDLVQAFADQAGVALERARAYETEREAARKLRELDELKSDFLSTVSHELRTPLTAIRGFAGTLAEHWPRTNDDMRRHMIDRIVSNAEDLTYLINNLLDFAGVERTGPRGALEPLEVASEVRRVARRLEKDLAAHRLLVEVPAGLAALADRKAFERVLGNLLANAAKFSPEGSEVTVRAVAAGDEVVLEVRDRGIGIPTGELGRIFERFYRVGRGDTAEAGGMGIGLAIVKEFVESQGGRVWVESEVGAGSVFRVSLRRAVAPKAAPSGGDAAASAS